MDNTQFIKVWDIAIRVFHWTLVGCYALAFISSENIPKLHVFFGYSVLFLVLFRILYGFVGSKYARFSDFLYRPAQIADYLKGLLIGRPKHYIGHNPAGGGYDRYSAVEFVVPHPHRPKSLWGKRTRTFDQT